MQLFQYIKKAWYNAMLPQATTEEHEHADFRQYFLGWPMSRFASQKTAGDVLLNVLLVVLGTLTVPVYVTIKRVPEFVLFNLLSEGFAWLEAQAKEKNGAQRFSLWAIPKYLFKSAGMLFRALISPIGIFTWTQWSMDSDPKATPRDKGKVFEGSFMVTALSLMVVSTLAVAIFPPLAVALLISVGIDVIVLPQLGEFDSLIKLFSIERCTLSDNNSVDVSDEEVHPVHSHSVTSATFSSEHADNHPQRDPGFYPALFDASVKGDEPRSLECPSSYNVSRSCN